MKSSSMSLLNAIPGFSLAVLLLGATGGAVAADTGDLTFQGDSSFQGAHGGQDINVAVVESGSGDIVAKESGTVSKTSDPAFSFTFEDALKQGETYEVHYWIDSNFGGGSAGACDPKSNDHQWNVSLGNAEGDISHTEEHRPGDTGDVCDTFSE